MPEMDRIIKIGCILAMNSQLFYLYLRYPITDNKIWTVMKTKTTLVCLALALIFTACNRYINTYEAAHGKAKCGRMLGR